MNRAQPRALGHCPGVPEAASFDRFPDHDRLGLLREFRRDIQHGEGQDLGATGQLELHGAVDGDEKVQQPEVVERETAAGVVVVFGPERLVPFPGIGKIVENHLADLPTLLVG